MKNYENCVVESIKYERSDTIEKQGKRDVIKKYLKKGYFVKEERNGYWVLVKPSRVVIKVKSSAGTKNVDIKYDILNYYGKKKISEKQIEKFAQDIKNEKIVICFTNGDYFIKTTA